MKEKFLKIICVKVCSLITASCFIVTAVGGSLSASDTSLSVNLYDDIFDSMNVVNRQYGMVTSARDSSSALTVVNIQDLHCHEQTQRNISEIIKILDKNYSLKSVFVEGGYADINISWADRIQNEKIKDLIIEKMLQDGYLTGAEYYAIKNRKYNLLKGIEEKDIHEANLDRLAKIIEKQPQYNFVFSKINKEIEVLENIYLNERNKRFTKKINEYADGKTDTLKFYRLLKKYVQKINEVPKQYNNVISINFKDYPNISAYIDISGRSKDLNSRQVSLELQTLINAVKNKIPYESYKKLLKITDNFNDVQKLAQFLQQFCKQHAIDLSKDFKELNSFFEASRLNNEINPVDLINEERILIGQIRSALSYDNTEYEISYINDFSKYFRQYLNYALNSSDWKYFQENFEKFRFLYSKYAAVDRINELDKEIILLNDYYQTNDIRNNIFVSNILNGQNYESESGLLRTAEQMLKQSKDVIVVITGGYHSDDLQSIFENRKINSIIITPSVSGNTKNAAKKYDSIIKEQAAVQSNALALKLMGCLPDKQQRNLMAKVAVEIYGKDNTARLQQVAGNDFDLSKIETAELDEQKKSALKDLIETTVSALIPSLPLNAGKDIFNPDIDAVMLKMCIKLYDMGFYFEKGSIYAIETSIYKDQDLLGIPAEIYSRMFAGLQKALFNVQKNRDLKNKLSIFETLKNKSSVFSFLAKSAPVWEEILFRTIPSLVIIFNPVIGISLFVVSQIAFLFSHTLVKWLVLRDSAGEKLDFAGFLREDIKNLSIPALAVSVPYILVSILNPLLWPAATASAIMIHYLFNGKLSIFKILKNNRLTNNYEIKIPLDELGVSLGDKVLVTYLHPECLVISRNIEEVNFLFDELSKLNPEKKAIYEGLIYPYTFEFTVRRGGVVNIKRLIHCSPVIKSKLEKGSNNITFVYKTEPVNVIEEKKPVQSADEQDKTSIVPKRGQNNIFSKSALSSYNASDGRYRYSASLPRLVPTIDNSPGIALLYRKIFDVATIQTAKGKILLKTNRTIENYLSIIKQAENKKFLENLVNNDKNYFKYRLFALMYLRAGGYDVYSADAIQDIKIKFVEALRNNSISVESNFDLRAVLTGVYILLEDFSRQYLEPAKEIEIYKLLLKAVVVRRGKSNTAIAKSNMTFVSADPLTMAHEIGHLILARASKSSSAERTLHELFADTVINLFSKITGLPEQRYQAGLYGLFNKSVNYNDVFQEEHAASWGFIEMIKDVSSRVRQDASWDILADAIISYTRRLSGRQLYNKTQSDNLKEVFIEYVRYLENNRLYPKTDLDFMFNFVKGLTQGETIVMGLLSDIKEENPDQYEIILDRLVEKLKPQKSYSKSRKKTTTYENDRQIINRLVVSQPENIGKVLDIIRSEILKNEFYDKYDFENLIKTEILIKFPNKLYEPAQKIEYEIYSVISAIVGQAVKSDYYRAYGTFSHREYLYAQSYINKIMRKERDFNSYFRETPGMLLTMTLLDKLPRQTAAAFEYPIIVLGMFFPKIRNRFLSEHKTGDISQIEIRLVKLENTTAEKIKDVLQIEISSINSLSFIKKIAILSKILTNRTIKDFNIEEHLKLNDVFLNDYVLPYKKNQRINLKFQAYNERGIFSTGNKHDGTNELSVLIESDIKKFEGNKFINTGLKVNGQTIWQIDIDGLLVFGAKDTNIQETAQALNGSKILDRKIKEILHLKKKTELDIASVIVDDQADGMFFYGRTAVIKTNQYAKTAAKILDSISVMYAQKTIISLANVSNNDLYSALSSGALRKAITVSQFEYLKKEFENSGKDMPGEITELRKLGIEIYVSVPAVDERYKDFGISGEIADSAVYDYYLRETFEIELIKEKLPLQQLENKIINSDKTLLIEMNLLKEIFRTTKDITETYNGLQSLLGNIKIKLGLKDIKIKDMENFAYSIDFSDLPAVGQDQIMISADIDNFSDAIGLEQNNIIRIILEDTKINEDVKKAFLNVIKERILAKTKLFKQNKSQGLKDKKMEILLGKLLFLQCDNADKTTLLPEIESFRGSESDMVRKVNELYGRSAPNNDSRIINTMIELIVMYCQEHGDKEIIAISDISKTDSYRKMLAAA